MYNIYDAPQDPFAKVNLLAIMPMSTMRQVLQLQKEAIARIEHETKNNGVCQLFFRNPIPGFGKKVIVQEAQSD
jgi:hypothetical protein